MSVRVFRVFEFFSVVEPGDAGLRVPVHDEGKAPVVVLLGVLEGVDSGSDCWGKDGDSWSSGPSVGQDRDKVKQVHVDMLPVSVRR